MKKYISISIFMLLFCLIAISCKKRKHYEPIKFENNSNESIVIIEDIYYPATSINTPDCDCLGILIYPHTFFELGYRLRTSKWLYEHTQDHLQFFVLSPDTINKYPCDTIKKYNNILKKIEVNYDYLNNNNWTIVYP